MTQQVPADDVNLEAALLALLRQRQHEGNEPRYMRHYAEMIRETGLTFANTVVYQLGPKIAREHPELAGMILARPRKEAAPKKRIPPPANLTVSPRRVRRRILGAWDSALADSKAQNLVVRVANLMDDADEDGDEDFARDMQERINEARTYLDRLLAVVSDPTAASQARIDWRHRDDMQQPMATDGSRP